MSKVNGFADWVRGELAQRDWDQAELWKRGGVSQSAISHVLAGDRQAGPDVCNAIAKAFGFPPEEVFRRAGLLPPAKNRSDRIERLADAAMDLTDAEQVQLLDIAEAWRKRGNGKDRKSSTG